MQTNQPHFVTITTEHGTAGTSTNVPWQTIGIAPPPSNTAVPPSNADVPVMVPSPLAVGPCVPACPGCGRCYVCGRPVPQFGGPVWIAAPQVWC